jgi:hypothetical protein
MPRSCPSAYVCMCACVCAYVWMYVCMRVRICDCECVCAAMRQSCIFCKKKNTQHSDAHVHVMVGVRVFVLKKRYSDAHGHVIVDVRNLFLLKKKYLTLTEGKKKYLTLLCAWPRHSWCQTGGIRAALAPPTNVPSIKKRKWGKPSRKKIIRAALPPSTNVPYAHTAARARGHVPPWSPVKPK